MTEDTTTTDSTTPYRTIEVWAPRFEGDIWAATAIERETCDRIGGTGHTEVEGVLALLEQLVDEPRPVEAHQANEDAPSEGSEETGDDTPREEDAAESEPESRETGGRGYPNVYTREVMWDLLTRAIEKCPGTTSSDLAEMLGRPVNTVQSRLTEVWQAGLVDREKETGNVYHYYPRDEPEPRLLDRHIAMLEELGRAKRTHTALVEHFDDDNPSATPDIGFLEGFGFIGREDGYFCLTDKGARYLNEDSSGPTWVGYTGEGSA